MEPTELGGQEKVREAEQGGWARNQEGEIKSAGRGGQPIRADNSGILAAVAAVEVQAVADLQALERRQGKARSAHREEDILKGCGLGGA
jgi:hypothetical protein